MRYKEFLIVLLICVIVALLFRKRPMYMANRLQTIEHVIHGKDSIVTKWKTKIVEDKSKIKGLSNQVDRLKDSLELVKELKDTVRIVEYQDTVIAQQDTIIRFYEDLTANCDSIITEQNEVIELKDSVIFIQRESIKDFTKKKKRRKLGEIIAGIGLLTLLIVK
tara:strand:+ start:190 stop:681 length:492 start_codon:yes stop_codon:yes gene_type:complete